MGTLLILLVLLPAAAPADDPQLAMQVRKLVAALDAPTLFVRGQVADAETALVSGHGLGMNTHATLVLGS